jgi:hypothetical protein
MATLRLVNTMGETVRTHSIPGNQVEMTLDVDDLPSGIYILSVSREGVTRFRKISVIQ